MKMLPVRYSKTNGNIYIGGRKNKLSIFTRTRTARLQLFGYTLHFGKWD